MFWLMTGLPGSSKTLHTIKMLREDELFQGRQVYYYNVKEVIFEDWVELTEDEVKHWYELPAGSVIFIDECQKIFRPRGQRQEPTKTVTEIETHRHNGFDIIATTQHPMLIDTAVRRQVGQHWHIERKFGFESARIVKWQECQDNPKDYHARQEAIKETHKFPKKYYGSYKSAEIHTVKKRIPAKLVVVLLMFLACVLFGWWLISSLSNRTDLVTDSLPDSPLDAFTGVVNGQSLTEGQPVTGFQSMYPLDPQEYLDLFKPRLDGQPNTAPIYDALMTPTVVPKTHCIRIHKASGSVCSCWTQQMTKVHISAAKCVRIIEDGLFDHVQEVTSVTYDSKGRAIDAVYE